MPEKDSLVKIFKVLRSILFIVIALVVALVVVVLGVSYNKTHSEPYDQTIPEELIPTFSSVSLDFVHRYDGSSLPMLASCIIDVDGDGIAEVFLGGGKNQPDALFRFRQGGFEPVAEAAGISKTLPDASYGAATIDVDDDGDNDLFVARDSGVMLYINTDGRFSGTRLEIPFDKKSTPISFAFADLDRNGAIDMFVSTYLPKSQMEGTEHLQQRRIRIEQSAFCSTTETTPLQTSPIARAYATRITRSRAYLSTSTTTVNSISSSRTTRGK